METTIKLENKICKCGTKHHEVPTHARYGEDFNGYFWECSCTSTMFHPVPNEKEETAMDEAV